MGVVASETKDNELSRADSGDRAASAVGRSGVEVIESRIDLYIGQFCLVKAGKPLSFNRESIARTLAENKVCLSVNLNLGSGTATGWGCDLSEEYVTINSHYTT